MLKKTIERFFSDSKIVERFYHLKSLNVLNALLHLCIG